MRFIKLIFVILLLPCVAHSAITFVASGTESGVSAAACAPGVPAGILNNDILITVLHSRTDTAHTCATNCTGWTEFSVQAGNATDGRLSVWWKRTSGSESAPTFGGPATESYACRIFAFRGVKTSGDPWNVKGTNNTHASAATYTGEDLTSVGVSNVMVVFTGGAMDNAVWGAAGGSVTNPTATDTACTTFNLCVDNGNGTDNSVFLAYDATPVNTPGALGAPTNVKTLASDPGRVFTLALEPAPVTCTPSGMLLGVSNGC